MRISLGTLDPASALARRIHEALEIDHARRRPVTAPARDEPDMSEEGIQRAVVAMLVAEARPDVLVFHPANGGRRGRAEAGRFKALGVVAGIPDLVAIANGRAFGLELKTEAGRLSEAQKATADRWRRAGGQYAVARSVGEARRILQGWLIVDTEQGDAPR